MSRTVTIIEDGTPEAAALGSWLDEELGGARRVTALRGAVDVAGILAARKRAGISERTAVLTEPKQAMGDVSGAGALVVVRQWLSDFGPFDARALGPLEIARRVGENSSDAGVVLDLLRRLALKTGSQPGVRRPGMARRGRPAGSKQPLRGVGFDVAVAILANPGRGFTERDLANACGRSVYGVHRVLLELERRAYIRRARGDIRAKDPLVLRDDLASAYAERLGSPRAASHYLAHRPRHVLEDLRSSAGHRGLAYCLAGPSAVDDFVGGPAIVYVDGDHADALVRGPFEANASSGGHLVVWPVLQPSQLSSPRSLEGHPTSNRIITYLDLAVSRDPRQHAAADALWATA